MSLFKKPKKIQRRVFSSNLDDDEEEQASINDHHHRNTLGNGGSNRMDCDEDSYGEMIAPPPPIISLDKKSKKHKEKSSSSSSSSSKSSDAKPKSLLSFADEEEEGEIFQVRKSSHSKKVMRMMDKERRKKRREERSGGGGGVGGGGDVNSYESKDKFQSYSNGKPSSSNNAFSKDGNTDYCTSTIKTSLGVLTTNSKYKSSSSTIPTAATYGERAVSTAATTTTSSEPYKSKNSDSIQTEIRTDDFVLVVKKSESNIILNGRAALCAGRDDMSDQDEEDSEDETIRGHRFSKPEQLKQMLESGSIPDAAMIHEARKRRQRAREQGDFIPVEEPKEVPKKGSRLTREDVEGDISEDEERVDMNGITGIKEREERREQFYAVENDSSQSDSDREMNDWESQQIRKGVTGVQLVNAQQESVLSRFMIKSSAASINDLELQVKTRSTASLLEQAYAKNSLDKPQKILESTKFKTDKSKAPAIRTPQEIRDTINTRLTKLRELNTKHKSDMERMTETLKTLRIEEIECKEKAPAAAAKYRFYQEVKCYVADLIECLNEKIPIICDLEKRALQLHSKHQNYLIERRRQDVRDQAKEMADASKPQAVRRNPDSEEQIRRAAEREGRRNRRRYEREKNNLLNTHLDGMSSDDETSDHFQEQFTTSLAQISTEVEEIFKDVNEEYCQLEIVLMKFYAWRKTDIEAYKDAFVSLCLPKIIGVFVRLELILWTPLNEDFKDIDKMDWYQAAMLFAYDVTETLDTLKNDPDLYLVPTVIERIILPKLTDIVKLCWDPLSTTQSLRLIGLINRLGRDFPLKENSKPLQQLFQAILDKLKSALDNDVFIPIFPKQVQEAKTSFFQRQVCSGLKLFRNFLSWQGIIADKPLRDLAIGSLLNRYLLLAMRVCTPNDAIAKAYIVVNTLPTVWLQPNSETLQNLNLFITYIKQIIENCDAKNPNFMQTCEKSKQILQRLHCL